MSKGIVRTRWRGLAKVIMGVAFSLGLLLGAEVILRTLGTFEAAPAPPSALDYAADQGFRDKKLESGYLSCGGSKHRVCLQRSAGIRISVYGGSALHGLPYTPLVSMTGWLQRYLVRLSGGRPVEVINHGFIGAQSANLLGTFKNDMGKARMDLAIIFSGNNEFYAVGARKKIMPHYHPRFEILRHKLWASRLYRLVASWRAAEAANEPIYGITPDAYQEPVTHADRELVTVLYRKNLIAMVRLARQAKVPIMLVTVPSNLRYRSHTKEITREHDQIFKELHAVKQKHPQRLVQAAKTLAREKGSSVANFAAAEQLYQAGERALALRLFQRAELLDPFPVRSNQDLRRAVVEAAMAEEIPYCDAAGELIKAADDGIPGDRLFDDHCHPSIEGHRQIGRILLRCIKSSRLLALTNSADIEATLSRTEADVEQPFRLDRYAQAVDYDQLEKEARRKGPPAGITGARPALAWTRAAFKLFNFWTINTGSNKNELLSRAMAFLEQALRAGGPEGPIRLSMGLVALHDLNPGRAHAELRRAAALLPSAPGVVNYAQISGAIPVRSHSASD